MHKFTLMLGPDGNGMLVSEQGVKMPVPRELMEPFMTGVMRMAQQGQEQGQEGQGMMGRGMGPVLGGIS